MNEHGWGVRLGWWLNVENPVPLYSLMVNFRIFIIRLFLSIRPVIYSGFVTLFVFVTREMVSQVPLGLGLLSTMNHWARNPRGSCPASHFVALAGELDSGRTHVAASCLAYSYSFVSPVPDVHTSYPCSVLTFWILQDYGPKEILF